MKDYVLALILFLISLKSCCQIDQWQTYDLDSIVYLDLPLEVWEVDTIIDNNRYYQIYSTYKSTQLIARKFELTKSQQFSSLTLPNDEESLKKFYLELIWTIDEANEFELDDYYPIEKNNLKGYQVSLINKKQEKVEEMVLFLVNKNLYSFILSNKKYIKEVDVKRFFNEIAFDESFELKQYPSKPFFSLTNTIILLLIFTFISFIVRVLIKRK